MQKTVQAFRRTRLLLIGLAAFGIPSPMACHMSILRCLTRVAVNPPIVLTVAFCGGSHVYIAEDTTAASVKQYEKQ